MNSQLYSKCVGYNFEALFKKKGYAYFTNGEYNVNIIGVRSNNRHRVTNKFDDVIIVDYKTAKQRKRVMYAITTEPGLTSMKSFTNSKGVAILVPGQYRGTYAIDRHNGKYKALCQRLKPVKVYRDNNKNDVYDLDPKTIQSGMFGINIHRSTAAGEAYVVNGYSAGCQVFSSKIDFDKFMALMEKSRVLYGNSFTYTLIDEDDLV